MGYSHRDLSSCNIFIRLLFTIAAWVQKRTTTTGSVSIPFNSSNPSVILTLLEVLFSHTPTLSCHTLTTAIRPLQVASRFLVRVFSNDEAGGRGTHYVIILARNFPRHASRSFWSSVHAHALECVCLVFA